MPGTAVFARNPGTTLMDIPLSEKIRSLGSLEIAWSSLRRLAEARANRKIVFHVQRRRSCLVCHRGGSNSSERRVRRTRERSHSGTLGRSMGREEAKALMSLDKQGWRDRGTPSNSPKAEAIEDL